MPQLLSIGKEVNSCLQVHLTGYVQSGLILLCINAPISNLTCILKCYTCVPKIVCKAFHELSSKNVFLGNTNSDLDPTNPNIEFDHYLMMLQLCTKKFFLICEAAYGLSSGNCFSTFGDGDPDLDPTSPNIEFDLYLTMVDMFTKTV